jgi:nucleotide-binding universal stress UspA family protein
MQSKMNILVATDGTPGAKAAVTDGLRLAGKLDAKILFVSAEHAPMTPFGVPPYYIVDPDAHAFAVQAVEEALAAAKETGVEAAGEVLPRTTDPAHAILQVARTADVDLIVVGSRGMGAIAGAILGSVSRSIVRHADRPVLVAKEYGHRNGKAHVHEHFFVSGGV